MAHTPDAVVEQYMAQAKAFIYAAYEDFGIAPVEAQACGTPVIAYGQGGTGESVKDFRTWGDRGTGILFPRQTVPDLSAAVLQFEECRKQTIPEEIRLHAEQFSPEKFRDRYFKSINRICLKAGLELKDG